MNKYTQKILVMRIEAKYVPFIRQSKSWGPASHCTGNIPELPSAKLNSQSSLKYQGHYIKSWAIKPRDYGKNYPPTLSQPPPPSNKLKHINFNIKYLNMFSTRLLLPYYRFARGRNFDNVFESFAHYRWWYQKKIFF